MSLGTGILGVVSTEFFDDDYDPLAPPVSGSAAEPEATLDESVEGGKIVRLRFEDGKLVSVRLSHNWYERLQPGQSLAGAFEEAFLLATATIAQPETQNVDVTQLDYQLPELSPQTIDNYAALLRSHSVEWQRAIQNQTPEPDQRYAMGEQAGVRVVLNQAGQPARIVFDEAWVINSPAGTISNTVLAATRKAYAQYDPQPDPRNELLDRYRIEHEILMEGFRRLLDSRREEK